MRDLSGQNLAPQGNAVLACGVISRARVWGPAATLILGFLILAAGAFIWRIISTPLPLPKTTFLLFYIRPSLPLPQGAPALWRETQIKSKPWPIVAGLAKNSNNQPYAFTVTPSLFNSWILHSPESAIENEHRPLSALTNGRDYLHRAWLQVWPSRMGDQALSLGFEQHFGGQLDSQSWTTDLRAPTSPAVSQFYFGTNFLNVQSLPFMWPIMENELRNIGINMDLSVQPAQISWRIDAKNGLRVVMGFEDSIDAGLRAQIAAGFGLVERQPYALSDGTISNELVAPIQTLSQSPTGSWRLDDGESLIFNEKTVLYGLNIEEEWVNIPPDSMLSPGILAIFDQKTLSKVAEKFGFKGLRLPESITLEENKGKLKISW